MTQHFPFQIEKLSRPSKGSEITWPEIAYFFWIYTKEKFVPKFVQHKLYLFQRISRWEKLSGMRTHNSFILKSSFHSVISVLKISQHYDFDQIRHYCWLLLISEITRFLKFSLGEWTLSMICGTLWRSRIIQKFKTFFH
jgi:hypothetical protein